MPACPKLITIASNKQPKCNCELCSATVGKPKKMPESCKKPSNYMNRLPRQNEDFDDVPCIKPVASKRKVHDCGVTRANSWYREPPEPSRAGSKASRLQDLAEEDDAPCRKRKADIIRRNKLAVKILSKQLKAVKSLAPPCDSRYDSVKLFPTAKHAMRWAPAYSLARSRSHICPKKKKKPPPKKPTDLMEKNRYCACELMANAIRADLTHHLGLSDQRQTINASEEQLEFSPSKVTEA